ncbi:MAG: hypothetical protein EHM21_03005, partial [Chloroflexi bacterium]
DIYALGATLYAALTGKIPEDGLSRAMGIAELTPVRRQNPQISERLARVIERAMAVLPADRYQTADAFKEELLCAAAKPQTAVVPVQPNSPVGQRVPAQGNTSSRPSLAIPSSVAPTVVQSGPGKPPKANAAPGIQAVPGITASPQPTTRASRKRGFPSGAIFGIGGVIVFGGVAALAFGLGLLNPLIPAPVQPTPSSTVSPAPAALPSATLLPPVATPTLSPSETPTAAPSDTPLPVATSSPAATFTPSLAATPLGGSAGQIAYSAEQDGKSQVWVIHSDGTGYRQVTFLPDGACQPDWSPDGKRLVFISPCQDKKDQYSGSSLYVINADGTGLTPLATLPGGDYDPAWSPDGKQIVFATLRDNNIPHIYLYNLADASTLRLSRPVNREGQPAWSPDGKQIAYKTTRLNQPQIWIMTSTGENAKEFSSLATAFDFSPAWSPDGSVVIFSEGNQPILVARQVGDRMAEQFPVSNTVRPADEARFSPDGWWLAFTLKQDGNTDIYIMTRNGANLTRLTTNPGGDFHPAWRP